MNSFDKDSADLERVDIHAALRQFVEYLPADKVQLLCMNGSIWARPLFLEAQEKAAPAFVAAGRAGDVAVRRWAASEGLVLLCDFNGLVEAFVDDDEDADRLAVRFSTESGRAELLACVDRDFAGDFDGFLARLPEPLQELLRG
jgi:hypothetical protein